MYLFFDTETTGLPKDFQAPHTDVENWNRCIQLASIITDRKGKILREFQAIIKPIGFEISEGAERVHGISTERAKREGKDAKMIFHDFFSRVKAVDTIVAHNIDFDKKIMGAEFHRLGLPYMFDEKELICTMKSTADLVGIKTSHGNKWPRLHELYSFLFDEEFENAHDAMADTKAMMKCFFELKNRGFMFQKQLW